MTSAILRRPRTLLGLGMFALALIVYTLTLAPTISFWDCGEYISTAHILGIPHQPGTPLYVLVGRCFDILLGLFGVGTAVAINFMSAFFSALGVAILYLIVSDLARRADPDCGWLAHVGGVVGALFLLFSETYWNSATEAEVYGLAGFMVCLLTWLALRWYDARQQPQSDRILLLVFYLLGLGVGFHLGSLLVYPAIFVLIFVAKDRRVSLSDVFVVSLGLGLFLLSTMTKNNSVLVLLLLVYLGAVILRSLQGRHFALIGSGLFVLGLSVHLYMLVRAGLNPAINQTHPDDFGTLMSVLRREQYPPINVFDRQAPFGWQFRYYYDFLLRQFTFLPNKGGTVGQLSVFIGPIFLGVLGVLHGLRRLRPWIWLLLVAYLVNADGLTLYLNFTDHEVRERDYFYGTGFLFFAMLIGLGTAALLRYATGKEGPAWRDLKSGQSVAPVRPTLLVRAAAGLLIVIAALPMLVPGHVKWFEHDRSENRIAREYAWNMLAGLDQGAILFTNGDNDTFPIWYLQEVEGFRRDVTVVNLSLVNLPWYIKQMRRREPPMPLNYTDAKVDQLQPAIYEDANSGQRQVVYVRDYIVHDLIGANAQSAAPRPIFFAVTIPQENMARYYPNLIMEGLAFRLTEQPGPENQPRTDAERLLTNVLGVYDYTAILDGDSEARQRLYQELASAGESEPGRPGGRLTAGVIGPSLDIAPLVELAGQPRVDVYRDRNTSNLLGNYPAAAIRAAYEYLTAAQQTAADDTVAYDRMIDKAAACLELARRFEPLYAPVTELYPLILVEQGRVGDAVAYLESLRGRITLAEEEPLLYRSLLMIAGSGHADAAFDLLERRMTATPNEKTAYRLAFSLHRNLKQADRCREIIERWRQQTGETDAEMTRSLEALEAELSGAGRNGGARSEAGAAGGRP